MLRGDEKLKTHIRKLLFNTGILLENALTKVILGFTSHRVDAENILFLLFKPTSLQRRKYAEEVLMSSLIFSRYFMHLSFSSA